jgi:serine/threonine protein kinase
MKEVKYKGCYRDELDVLRRLTPHTSIIALDGFNNEKQCLLLHPLGISSLGKPTTNWFSQRRPEELFGGVESALQHLHTAGFVHRDIRPENIVISADQNKLILIDFGIAKNLDEKQEYVSSAFSGVVKFAPTSILTMYGGAREMVWSQVTDMTSFYMVVAYVMYPVFRKDLDRAFQPFAKIDVQHLDPIPFVEARRNYFNEERMSSLDNVLEGTRLD